MGKELRVHARRHKPTLLVIETQLSLRSLAARPQLARLRHHQRVVEAAGLGPPKRLLRPHERRHQPVVDVAQAHLAV